MFSLQNAELGYGGRPVLSNVSLSISAGERVAVIGPSGAGKSTLLHALHASAPARVALVPQDGALVKPLSVFHNVYIGQLNRRSSLYNLVNLVRPFAEPVAQVSRVLASLGLLEKLYEPVGSLSGGQQQRTAVARAVYRGGDALLGDEPVSAVDRVQAREVLEVIKAACATVVLVLHDVVLAREFATRLIGLKGGVIAFDRPAAELSESELAELYR